MSWEPVDHLCRVCGGRILLRVNKKKEKSYRCSNCGSRSVGTAEAICYCGNERVSGLRCVRNDEQTALFPHEVVVQYVGSTPTKKKSKGEVNLFSKEKW
jgi:hypothetical protein